MILVLLIGLTLVQELTVGPVGAEWVERESTSSGRTQVPSSRVVSTRKGSLRGLYVAFDDKQLSPVEMFLGVPYASPPVRTFTTSLCFLSFSSFNRLPNEPSST